MKYTDNNTLNKWYKVDENRLIKRQLKEIENIFFPEKVQISENFKNIINRMNDL